MNQDMAGHCMYSSCSYWDHKYNEHNDLEEFPRSNLSNELGICTAFGMPLPGPSGACGVLVLYSRKKIDVDPLLVSFVEVGTKLLSASALDSRALAHFDIESWTRAPRGLIQDWVDEENDSKYATSWISNSNCCFIRISSCTFKYQSTCNVRIAIDRNTS